MSLVLDTTGFSFDRLIAEHPSILEKVVVQTAMDIKAAAETQPPMTPHREGNLRADVAISPLMPGTAEIYYKQPYAHYQHEGISRFSGRPLDYKEAGCGAKFLEAQLTQGEKWGKHMAEIHKDLVDEA